MRSLKTLKIMAYLPKSWVVLSLQAYVLLGPQNRFSPLFMAFWWIAKSFCRRKLQQHLLQLCKSALRWYIFLSRTTGLSTIYRSGQISQWIFWHRNIVYLSMRHTHYILVPLWPIFHSQCTAFKTNNSWKKHEVSA